MKLTSFLLIPMALAASATDDVRAVLDRQQSDWNRGDISAFMQGYDDSEETAFVGTEISKGRQHVLERYLKRYPTKATMGTLAFSAIEVRPLGKDYACVVGRFHLTRTAEGGGDAAGIFTLVLRKTAGGWKVILDHTS